MSILVTWENDPSATIDSFKGYRSTNPQTLYSVENELPIQLNGSSVQMLDQTAENDTIYWYGLVANSQLGPIYSVPKIGRAVVAKCGPGSQQVIAGNFSDGLMERLDTEAYGSLIGLWRTISERYVASTGITLATRTDNFAVPGFPPKISKIAFKGNVLFFNEEPNFYMTGPSSTAIGNFKTNLIDTTKTISTDVFDFKARAMTKEEFISYQLCFGGMAEELRFYNQVSTRTPGNSWMLNDSGAAVFAVYDSAASNFYYSSTAPNGNSMIAGIVLEPQ